MRTSNVTSIGSSLPTAICQNVTLNLAANGTATLTPAQVNNGSFDACSPTLTYSLSKTSFNCSNAGTNTVTLTVTGAAANTSTCTAVITIQDVTVPTITCPATVTIECSDNKDPSINTSLGNPTVFDNCNSVTNTYSDNLATLAGCTGTSTFTRTWTTTDVSNNTATCSQQIAVRDNTKPIVIVKNITKTLNAPITISFADINNGTNDNCTVASDLMITLSKTNFNCSNIGTNTIIVSVADACGNTSVGSAVVTILDGTLCNTFCTTSISDPCVCKNNSTTIKDGQFSETATTNGLAGMNFRVKTLVGLYKPTIAAPPSLPTSSDLIPQNTPLVPQSGNPAKYDLKGTLIDSVAYSLVVERVDALGTVIPGSELSMSNLCYYPTPNFIGLNTVFNTLSAPITLNASEINGSTGTKTFFINGIASTVLNPAILGVGVHNVEINFDATDASPNDGKTLDNATCLQKVNKSVAIMPSTLVCHNAVNLSLGSSCSLIPLPEFFFPKNAGYTNAGFSVTIFNGINLIPQPLTVANVGKIYTYKLTDLVGNSCTGTLKIEDNEPPKAICPNTTVTVKCSDLVNENTNGTFTSGQVLGAVIAPTFTDCSDVTASYSDNVADLPCASGTFITKRINRTYKMIDIFGNQSFCEQTINFERTNLNGGILSINKKQYNCDETFVKDAKGNPAPSSAGIPTLTVGGTVIAVSDVCDLSYIYTDVKIPICGTGYTITRQWLVTDNCSNLIFTTNQTIEIKDISKPVFTSTFPDITISTSLKNCVSDAEIDVPKAKDNCDNNLIYTLNATSMTTAIGFTAVNGVITIKGLAVGTYILVWTATDNCGNSQTATQKMEVKDLVAPIAVCDLNTKVSLGTNGNAILLAEVVNDGSNDNCCLDVNSFEIKRISETTYNKSITFTCADSAIMVMMRVSDCYGNSNVCMVNVIVEDKLSPVAFGRDTIVCCGNTPDATTWLNANSLKTKSLIDYPSANNPGYYDNCNAKSSYLQSGSIDNCGNGTVKHTITIKDKSGLSTTAITNYISENRSAYTVTFPQDVILTCTDNKTYATDPIATGEPNIKNLGKTCPLVGVEYKDEIFKVVPDACFKIIRTWKVLNWCQPQTNFNGNKGEVRKTGSGCTIQDRTYTNIDLLRPDRIKGVLDPDAPCRKEIQDIVDAEKCYAFDTDGYMEFQQIIKVIDLTPPTIVAGTVTTETMGKECKTKLTISKPNSTDCTGVTADSYEIINVKDNYIVQSGTTFLGEKTFTQNEYGDYIVRFKTSDACGNFNSTDVKVTVKDTKKPTPVCHHWIAAELMATKMVMIDAKILDAGSYDNCTTQSKLKLKIQVPAPDPAVINITTLNPDTMKTSYTFVCPPVGTVSDPANPNAYLIKVALWVGDEAGNWDYCETEVNVQDNQNICGYSSIQMKSLGGEVVTEKNESVENTMLKLEGTKTNKVLSAITGKYQFKDLPILGQYTITPEKNTNPLNGVSTLDLVMISKHILGVQPLTSPYQMIAADVNRNGTITTADVVELRKMILAVQSNFTKNTSWRFVDRTYQFPSPSNPFLTIFPENIKFQNGITTATNTDFIGVKIGDVNGNATTNGNATGRGNEVQKAFSINTDEQLYKANDEVRMTLNAKDFANIMGYQFTFEYDNENLELLNIEGNKDNFEVRENGIITTSAIVVAEASEELFTLVFRAKKSGILSQSTKITSSVTAKEAYNKEAITLTPVLEFNNEISDGLELYQNHPNPFNDATVISFNLPQNNNATLTISDISGKIIKHFNNFNKGYNEVKLNKTDLGISGIFYYQLEQNGQKLIKKLVVID